VRLEQYHGPIINCTVNEIVNQQIDPHPRRHPEHARQPERHPSLPQPKPDDTQSMECMHRNLAVSES
jgi:hypothetical protein